MGITDRLSRFIVETDFNDIPGEAITVSKRHFLDCLGTTLAGSSEKAGKIITDYIREIGGTAESRLVVSGVRTSSANAALANGIMAHVLDFDDTGFSHPTGCIVPVLLALGEKQKLPGKDILAAQVLGYECFGKLSSGAHDFEPTLRRRGYHPTPLWGTMAAAATAAKLLKLSADQTAMALGMAGSQAAGLTENFGTMTKGFHSGNSARAGILAARLVQKGYTAGKEIIEGAHGFYHAIVGEGNYNLEKIEANIGKTWDIVTPGVAIKRYPCCGGNLRALDTILSLIEEHKINFRDVDFVEVTMNSDLRDTLRFDKPANGYQGKFSMEYNMAAAILDGKVDIDSFGDSKANSAAMKEALGKIKIVIADVGHRYNPVRIRMKNNQEYTRVVETQKGHPNSPISDEELQAKYRYCAGRANLAQDKIERSIDLVSGLEKVSNIASLMDAVMGNNPLG